MAKNTFKTPPRPKSTKSGSGGLFRLIESYVKMDIIFENGLPVKYIPYILFLTGIAIFYIGNTHHAETIIRKTAKLKTEVEDLRADYTTLKAEYMVASKQSEVAKRVAEAGLYESSVPPYKIIIEDIKK